MLFSCSVEKDTVTSLAYHNTLARYNGYFIAKETTKEIEKTIRESEKPNYNRTLKIYPDIDENLSSSFSSQLEEINKKASLPIQRHKNSKWVDNSYILIGRSRFYDLDFDNATITFKYVNSISDNPDDKHESLCWLLRTFIVTEQYDNAYSIIGYLKNQKLNQSNRILFSLNKAFLYQKIDEKSDLINELEAVSEIINKRYDKAKVNFILGQLYQDKADDELAYLSYKKSIKNSDNYEMTFYGKLYKAQVTSLGKESDNKKIYRFYNKLLKNEKNVEYKDKIYYELSKFEYKQKNPQASIKNLKSSLKHNSTNKDQKAYSYLFMAEIFDNDFKNYKKASNYYDSTLTVLDKTEHNYELIKKRAKILKEFVEQITIIETEDSLQHLAKLDTTTLYAFIDSTIKANEEKERISLEKKQRKLEIEGQKEQNNMDLLNNSRGVKNKWYFYNPNSISKGKVVFTNKWGDRTLADNWRRQSKDKVELEEVEISKNSNEEAKNENTSEADNIRIKAKRAKLLSTIPFSKGQLKKSNDRIELALYILGGIYNLKLEEKKLASDTYEKLLERFPANENKLEVYYILYLINKDTDIDKSNHYKNMLLNKYSNSVYAKLILDPEYLIKNEQLNKQAQTLYANAYNLHNSEKYVESSDLCNKIIVDFPENDIMDKIEFLKALNIGLQDTTVILFKQAIKEFIADYPESDLIPLANEYLGKVNGFINEQITKKPSLNYIVEDSATYNVVLLYKDQKRTVRRVINKINKYNKGSNYVINSKKYKGKEFLITINGFASAELSQKYLNKMQNDNILVNWKENILSRFVISDSNLNILMSNYDLDLYLKFYKENYN